MDSEHLKSVNSHRELGGSWSRNAELSSVWTRLLSSRLKLSAVTGIGGVLVSERRTVVAFGLVSRRHVCVACQKHQQSHLEFNVYVSSRGSCGDAKVDSERRPWKDLSGMSLQKVLLKSPESKQERAPPCLHEFGLVAPIRFRVFFEALCNVKQLRRFGGGS